MIFSFHPAAKKEFDFIVSYYNSCKDELGSEFSEEVFSSIQRIMAFPDAWTLLSPHIRRCLIRRFPYGIIFHHIAEEIIILAIMQLNRKPSFWLKRMKKISKF